MNGAYRTKTSITDIRFKQWAKCCWHFSFNYKRPFFSLIWIGADPTLGDIIIIINYSLSAQCVCLYVCVVSGFLLFVLPSRITLPWDSSRIVDGSWMRNNFKRQRVSTGWTLCDCISSTKSTATPLAHPGPHAKKHNNDSIVLYA